MVAATPGGRLHVGYRTSRERHFGKRHLAFRWVRLGALDPLGQQIFMRPDTRRRLAARRTRQSGAPGHSLVGARGDYFIPASRLFFMYSALSASLTWKICVSAAEVGAAGAAASGFLA